MDVFEVLADRKVICAYPEGPRKLVHIRIGKPEPLPDGDWRCPVAMDGLHGRLAPAVGIDAFQTLLLAFRLPERLLQAEVECGAKLLWPEDDTEITVAELFNRSEYKE